MTHRSNGIAINRRIHLCTDPPHPDETWASFFDRATAQYCINRDSLFAQLACSPRVGLTPPIDAKLPKDIYTAVLSALHRTEQELPNDPRGIDFQSMSPYQRTSYCPLCFLDDLSKHRTPYFRFDWTIPMIAACRVHGCPLMAWRRVRCRDERILPFEWATSPHPSAARFCPWLDEDLRAVDAQVPDRISNDSPFSLVRRLGDEFVQLDVEKCAWRLSHGTPYAYAVQIAIELGLARVDDRTESLADMLRPATEKAWLFGPRKDRALTRPIKRAYAALLVSPLAWRRSVLWFAARWRYHCGETVALANGDVVRAGPPTTWWRLIDRTAATPLARHSQLAKKLFASESGRPSWAGVTPIRSCDQPIRLQRPKEEDSNATLLAL